MSSTAPVKPTSDIVSGIAMENGADHDGVQREPPAVRVSLKTPVKLKPP
jgi:hypothetical protein